ncbi:uncharacterized protein LOC130190607 [Pseudoliparis swirei]|uniref:uncharacterized protein LOC130190607 n=1 Tax=Pseudoliparis swirei TaxID=2059687 RepID=UPI0024BF00B9|nr:uncharacterized protein LOC130190607 [Pseudoliparis swirei]
MHFLPSCCPLFTFLHPMWKLRYLHNRGRSLRLLAEVEMQPPSPRRRCRINVAMPLLALCCDGHSDMRVDFRLTESHSTPSWLCWALTDHGWGPEISCLVFIFGLPAPPPIGWWPGPRQAPGSVHDARVLNNSPIFYEQSSPPPGYCILGDGGSPCLSQPICLMTSFRQPVHLQATTAACQRRGVLWRGPSGYLRRDGGPSS